MSSTRTKARMGTSDHGLSPQSKIPELLQNNLAGIKNCPVEGSLNLKLEPNEVGILNVPIDNSQKD